MDIKEEYKRLRDIAIEGFFTGLNDEQLEAVLSAEDKVLVAACPGAGKTQVIINRILYLTTFGMTFRSGKVPENVTEEDIRAVRKLVEEGDFRGGKVPEILSREAVKRSNIVVITFTKMAAMGMADRYRKAKGRHRFSGLSTHCSTA